MILEAPFKYCLETVVKMSQKHLHSYQSLMANHLTFSIPSDVETCPSHFWTIIQSLLGIFSLWVFVNMVCVIWTATFYPAGCKKSHKKWLVMLKSFSSSIFPLELLYLKSYFYVLKLTAPIWQRMASQTFTSQSPQQSIKTNLMLQLNVLRFS